MNKASGAKFFTIAVILTITLLVTSNSFAFDGNRKGFFFSFGMGPGFTSYKQTTTESGIDIYEIDESKFAALTNFNIGFAPSEKLMIHWMNKVAWFSILDTTISQNDAQTFAMSVGGLGITYYLKPTTPSLYLNIGAGLAARTFPFRGDDPWIGFGMAGGIGYEISKNWNLELSFLFGATEDEFAEIDTKYKGDGFGVGLTINVIAY